METNIYNYFNLLSGKVKNLNKKVDDIQGFSDLANVLFVSAKGNTDYKTITDAINDAIKLNPSNRNRVLINVGPGNYQENIEVPNFVYITGAGDATILSPLNITLPVVILNNYSILQNIKIIV